MEMDSRGFPGGGIRVSDADRDRAIAELSEHFQSGRLTQDEFDDRSGRALQARTGVDLSDLFTDLPPRTMAPVPPAEPEYPEPGYGPPARPGSGVPVARVVIGLIIASIVVSNVVGGNVGHGHGLGWLAPVIILGFLFLRLARHRQ
jgi:hypothetical protein